MEILLALGSATTPPSTRDSASATLLGHVFDQERASPSSLCQQLL